jgi:mRNA interferase RelE/StbE
LVSHRVLIANAAKRELKKLTKQAQADVVRAISRLAKNPRPRGVEKLQGYPAYYRLRRDPYRVVYTIRPDILAVIVLVIRDRKDAFKGLGRLDDRLAHALSILSRNVVGEEARRGPLRPS